MLNRTTSIAPLALMVALSSLVTDVGCSLGNVKYSSCSASDDCAQTFGPGSTCSDGFCSAPASCTTGHDCRKAAGGGACVNGICVGHFPTNPNCTQYTEPENLLSQRADGPNAPLIIGGIFSLAAAHDQALTDPIRLAVNEINQQGGMLNSGQQIGIVFCDNGGPGDMATGSARAALNVEAFDYLAGTLGVPYIVGPLTSSDSLTLIGELNKQKYPTVIISPSATSPTLSMTGASLSGTRMFWRTCPNDTLQGEVLAKDLIGANTKVQSVAVVYISDAYGGGLETAFQMSFAGTTNPVPYSATTPMTPAGLTQIATIANSTPNDAVLLIAEEGSVALSIITALSTTPLGTKPLYLTDGSMDTGLLSMSATTAAKAMIQAAFGTAPADPDSTNVAYKAFNAGLLSQFSITGNSQSFLAQAYDATYVGAYGVVYASRNGSMYDGIDVAKGMALLEAGMSINLGYLDFPTGKGALISAGQINVQGTSGPLQFDPSTGEAPGAIQIWGVQPNLAGFTTINVIPPT